MIFKNRDVKPVVLTLINPISGTSIKDRNVKFGMCSMYMYIIFTFCKSFIINEVGARSPHELISNSNKRLRPFVIVNYA